MTNKFTIKELESMLEEQKEQEKSKNNKEGFDLIDNAYFFRAVTYHCIGRVVEQKGNILKLEEASWIPDSATFMNFIKNGELNKVEPVGVMYLNIDTVVDFFAWNHPLPNKQQ